MTRLTLVDDALREKGYPDCLLSTLHEDLFCFACNFAAEADRLDVDLEEARAIVADLLKACKLTTDLCEAAAGITCWTPAAIRVLGQTYAANARAAMAKAETAKEKES